MLVSESYQHELFCHFCHDWCVHPMNLVPKCVLNYAMSSLQRCLPCIFVINVVTSTSMQTSLHDNADFSSCSAVILMPCKHVATERSMHNLRDFSKGVLKAWCCSIHPWSWMQLWSSLACHFRALLFFKMFLGRVFTCYSILWGFVRLRLVRLHSFVFFMDSFFFLAGFQARWPLPWISLLSLLC